MVLHARRGIHARAADPGGGESVVEYRKSLEITENQVKSGTADNAALASAQAQLQAAEAQLVAVEQTRGTYEHAIAVLTGHLPSELSVPAAPSASSVPAIPIAVPSTLLERNPTVAAAERQIVLPTASRSSRRWVVDGAPRSCNILFHSEFLATP
jgi:outer membrane protein TolC